MHNKIKMHGQVDRIKVNDTVIEQNKPNTILNQGFNTLLSLSQTPYSTNTSSVACPTMNVLSQSGWLRRISTYDAWFGGLPCIGCMFGKDDSATTDDMTSLASPIGTTDSLASFGFHRSDIDYQSSFVIYKGATSSTQHYMKYCWKATEDATIKEIGIYSFSMDSSMASAGYTQSNAKDLSYYTDRKIFSRCVLQTPVEVKTGDTVVVYYTIQVDAPYEYSSLHTVSNIFGMPAVMKYMGEYSPIAPTISNNIYSLGPVSSDYKFTVSSFPSTSDAFNILDLLNHLNISSTVPISAKTAGYTTTALMLVRSDTAKTSISGPDYMTLTRTNSSEPAGFTRSATLDYMRSTAERGDGMNSYKFEHSIDKSSDIWTKRLHIEAETWYSTANLENKYWYLCYGPFMYFLNSTLSDSGTITMTPFDMAKTAKFTFDISNTFVRD